MTFTKKPDWFIALYNYIKTVEETPFKWGVNDCCLFACNCVEVMTGSDPGAEYRGKYKTAKGSVRALKKYGGGSIENAFTRVFGQIHPPLLAHRGDLALVDTPLGLAVGVVLGSQVKCVGETGLVTVPLNSVKGVWQVGKRSHH